MALRCEVCKHKDCPGDKYPCSECDRIVHDLFMEEQKQTQGERIRAMSDEELAKFLNSQYENASIMGYKYDYIGMLQWLKSEVKE